MEPQMRNYKGQYTSVKDLSYINDGLNAVVSEVKKMSPEPSELHSPAPLRSTKRRGKLKRIK